MVRWFALWAGSIIAFVIFVVVTQLMIIDWPGDRGDTGIKLAYNKDLVLSSVHFSVDSTKNPTNIRFDAVVDVENRQDYALLFLVIPYSGTLKSESGWVWKPFEDSTLLVKEFSCTPENPCSFADSNQFFDFDLDVRIDQKQSAHHTVRLWFFESSPLLDPEISKLVGQFNPERKPYNVGFDEIQRAKATVIFDGTADSFGKTPDAPIVPGPQEKLQLDWDIQSGILHQIDFQIPSERDIETQMVYSTAVFGIALGITNLAIFGMQQKRVKFTEDFEKKFHLSKLLTENKGKDEPKTSDSTKEEGGTKE